jgi:hypothetical protein
MVLDQGEGAEMQAGSQRDAVDPGVERRRHAHAQRFARRVHGQLLHAVDEDQAVATLRLHGPADVHARRLGELPEIEANHRLVGIGNVEFVLSELVLDELGVEAPIGNGIDHGIGDVSDATQSSRFECQFGGRNIDPHAADHNRHQFLVAKPQTEIINALHQRPSQSRPASSARLTGDHENLSSGPLSLITSLHGWLRQAKSQAAATAW